MGISWYYVQGSDRIGPVSEAQMGDLASQGTLHAESYVWKKGMEGWEKLKDVPELSHLLESHDIEVEVEAPPTLATSNTSGQTNKKQFFWDHVDPQNAIFSIKIGADRGGQENEYGPYSLDRIKVLFEENRINGKTLIFAPGMESWEFLAEVPLYKQISHDDPPVIEDHDRRASQRRPFVARMFFHNNSKVFEGICRDISIGGLQILVAGFPGKVGDQISLNVHPDNGDHSFVASGKVVRLLEGGSGLSLRFVELSKEAHQAIDSYVKSNER